MIFATMPPAPTREQCTSEPGVAIASNANWVEKLGGWMKHKVDGNQATWVDGNADEMKVGTTTEITTGKVIESHGGLKNEFIFGAEVKLNLGVTSELCVAARLEVMNGTHTEFALGPRVEFLPGEGRIIRGKWLNKAAEEKEEIAHATKVIAKYERTILGTAEETVGKLEGKANMLEWKVKSMVETCQELENKAPTTKVQTDAHKRQVSGKELHKPGSFSVNSDGPVEMGGLPAEMQAGVKVLCSSSKVTANGSDIVVQK